MDGVGEGGRKERDRERGRRVLEVEAMVVKLWWRGCSKEVMAG